MTRTDARAVLVVHPGAELFGSDRMALESVIGLRESGDRVVVALPQQGPLVPLLQEAGAEVVIIPMLVLRKALLRPSGWLDLARDTFRGLGAAWRLLSKVRPRAVYVSTITIPEWPIVARLRGVRVVSHVHEAEASGSTLVNRILYTPHLAAHAVLVNSEFSLRTLRSALPSLAERALVVYNGVASPIEPAPPRSSIDGALRVTYVGRLSPRKGPDVALDAVSSLGREGVSVDLTLVGAVFDGYEWFEDQLRQSAAAAPENVSVRFAGFHEQIWPFLESTDVLVVPSRFDEPFGNTAVEGILALRPVIASDTSGLREAAGGYRSAEFARPADTADLAEKIRAAVERWPQIVADIEADRNEALGRHAPHAYRLAIRGAIGEPSAR